MRKNIPYTQDEIEFVKRNYKTTAWTEIARMLNRSESGIRCMASRYGMQKDYDERKAELKPLENEAWKPIREYEGQYEISNYGRVKSIERMSSNGNRVSERIMKNFKDGKGYNFVCLTKFGLHKQLRVHRLVAEAFIPNPDNLPQVNHIDENKTNNMADNLEWVTAQQNMTHNDLHKRCAKKILKAVFQCTKDGKIIKEYESAKQAAIENGISRNAIQNICRGITKKPCGGYYWRYNEEKTGLRKSILKFDIDGNFIDRFEDSAAAGRSVGGDSSCIRRCCHGQQKTAHGFIWRYETDVRQEQQKNEQQDKMRTI